MAEGRPAKMPNAARLKTQERFSVSPPCRSQVGWDKRCTGTGGPPPPRSGIAAPSYRSQYRSIGVGWLAHARNLGVGFTGICSCNAGISAIHGGYGPSDLDPTYIFNVSGSAKSDARTGGWLTFDGAEPRQMYSNTFTIFCTPVIWRVILTARSASFFVTSPIRNTVPFSVTTLMRPPSRFFSA